MVYFVILVLASALFTFYISCIPPFWKLFLMNLIVCLDFPTIAPLLIIHRRNFTNKFVRGIRETTTLENSDTDDKKSLSSFDTDDRMNVLYAAGGLE